MATLSPDFPLLDSACLLGHKVGLPDVPAVDVQAQYFGFISSLAIGDYFIRGRQYRNVLIVGSEKHSMALESCDRGRDVTVLFQDGAGAALLVPTEEDRGLLSTASACARRIPVTPLT